MKFLLTLVIILCSSIAFCQEDSTIIIHKDSRLEALMKKQSDINRVASFKTSNGSYKGYRIMVLNTNDREFAYKTKGQLLSRFPDHAVYVGYQAPFFKLKMGDFVKKEDAEDLRKQLTSMMPKGVFVVQDIIKMTPEEEQKYLKELEEKGN